MSLNENCLSLLARLIKEADNKEDKFLLQIIESCVKEQHAISEISGRAAEERLFLGIERRNQRDK